MPKLVVDFRDALNRSHLATMLGTTEAALAKIFAGPVEDIFTKHSIPKRNRARGMRVVWEIREESTGAIYKTLLFRFHDFAAANFPGYPGPVAHGYVPKRSIVTNAKEHLHARLVLNADIKSFFPSITQERLKGFLLSEIGLAKPVATDIAALVTIEGKLALGLPPSPMFANLVCMGLDQRLSALAARTGSTFTRYADDLTFSGDTVPTRQEIASTLEGEGFALAEDKFRIKKRGQATFVTGLSVADAIRPRVPKEFKRRLRQELHYCQKHSIQDHIAQRGYGTLRTGVNEIDGRIHFLRGVERALGLGLQQQWETMLARDGLSAEYTTRMERLGEPVTIFVDETTIEQDGRNILVLLCAVVENVDRVRAPLEDLRDTLVADPFTTTKKKPLRSKGLHFTELSDEARQRAFEVIARIPCQAYAVYDTVDSSYADTYERLLRNLLVRRFIKLDRRPVEVVCEKNGAIRTALPGEVVTSIYENLRSKDGRRPLQLPKTSVAGKEDAGLWLADGLLWALRSFAMEETRSAQARFERLRHSFRLITDLASGTAYTRRRPFPLGALARRDGSAAEGP